MSLSLRQSLLAGFGIVLSLFILSSIHVHYESAKIHDMEDKLLNNRLPSVLANEKLLDGIDLSLAGLRGYMILGGDPEKAKKFKAEKAAGWAKIEKTLAEYEKLAKEWTHTENIQRLQEVKKLLSSFREAQKQVEDISHTPENIESINILLTEAAPVAQKVVSGITEMINIESSLPATPERKAALKLMADSRGSFALGIASIRAYLLSGDKKFKDNFDDRWSTNEKRLQQLKENSHLFSGKQRTAWENYQQHRAKFESLPSKMFLLREKADWNKANYLLGTNAAPIAEKIKILLNELSKTQLELTTADKVSLDAEGSHLNLITDIMTLLSLIAGITIALYLSHMVSVQLKSMVSNAKAMAEGNLSIPTLSYCKISDFNSLADALNNTRDQLNHLVARIAKSSNSLYKHSDGLKSLIANSQSVIQQQQQETDLIATAMNEMSSTVKEVARNTSDAAVSAEKADQSTLSGHAIVVDTVDSIDELAQAIEHAANTINQLSEETNAVDSILVSISGIADQTNLLALNAAIEAARAGEQGRGFAVVADEVRTLAARTQESTTEIRSMLDRLKSGANNAVDVMGAGHKQAQASVEKANTAKSTLQSITETVNVIKDMNTQIATAAEEQSAVTEEMGNNIKAINNGSHAVVEQAQASLISANEMASMASQLAESVAIFKLTEDVATDNRIA